MIHFACWNCGKALKANDASAGKKCLCKQCNESNTIPSIGTNSGNPIQKPLQAVQHDHTLVDDQIDQSQQSDKSYPESSSPQQIELGKVFCYKCGASIFVEAEICPKCGVRQRRVVPNTTEEIEIRRNPVTERIRWIIRVCGLVIAIAGGGFITVYLANDGKHNTITFSLGIMMLFASIVGFAALVTYCVHYLIKGE